MSKAFTREENDGPDIPDLPPLASPLPEGARNYMTAEGAQRLREELEQLTNEKRPGLLAATDDADAKRQLAVLDQRIRQLEQSLQSAEIVPRPKGTPDTVRFGATVTVREESGEESTYRIVGVDGNRFRSRLGERTIADRPRAPKRKTRRVCPIPVSLRRGGFGNYRDHLRVNEHHRAGRHGRGAEF